MYGIHGVGIEANAIVRDLQPGGRGSIVSANGHYPVDFIVNCQPM
jgi:hypothetical protein